jgi:hypothetical protein
MTNITFRSRNPNNIYYRSLMTTFFFVTLFIVTILYTSNLCQALKQGESIGQVEWCILFSLVVVCCFNIPYKFSVERNIIVDSLLNSMMATSVLLLNLVLSHSLALSHKVTSLAENHMTLKRFYAPKILISLIICVSMFFW